MIHPFYNIDPLVHENYLLTLNPRDLQNACRSNRVYAELCSDDEFWMRKLIRDFKFDTLKDYIHLSYKQKMDSSL